MKPIYCSNPLEQFKSHENKIVKSIKKVLESNKYILGPEVKKFEKNFANYIGVKYSVGVSNGTDALKIALKAIGIKKGDEVITVSHTAIATISAIVDSGANPVFADIEKESFLMDANKVKRLITKKTKAIIAVHIYGQAVELNILKKITKELNIYLIEDVSQAHGAKLGKNFLGSIGDIGCFSCYPTKNLGAIGDAGVITTNNKKLFKKISLIREYGWKLRNNSLMHGENSRLDELQAAILNVKLDYLNSDNKKRNIISNYYSNNLNNKNILSYPQIRKNTTHVFHLYVLRVKKRDKFLKELKNKNIYASIHYPIPAHKQKPYCQFFKKKSNLKITEKVSKEIISLPIYPELKKEQLKHIIKIFNRIN
jgi:dTDP-4-amino-4,6-dideoxygalactose transaminase